MHPPHGRWYLLVLVTGIIGGTSKLTIFQCSPPEFVCRTVMVLTNFGDAR